MAVERVRPKEGKDMSGLVPVKEEKLNQPEPGDELGTDEEALPEYKREAIGPRIGDPAKVAEEATSVQERMKELDQEDMVPLLFPRKVMLQHEGIMHTFEQGVHMVAASLADHWWLKHNKVRKAGPVVKQEEK